MSTSTMTQPPAGSLRCSRPVLPVIVRWHARFAPPHSRVPRSRCHPLPKIIIMKSRTDANAINHSKQKRKARALAGAAYPRVSRELPGGRFPVPHRPAACSRVCARASQMTAGSAAIVRLPSRLRAGYLLMGLQSKPLFLSDQVEKYNEPRINADERRFVHRVSACICG
jgi:hypothetical protein